jgi:protein involved in polysaccharide export with SLBB domain
MRKLIILLFLALPLSLLAQSSMTDSQVASYIQQEVKRGTSQSQIVTHLMQNGVDISQIRRVRNAYERMQGDKGLGTTTTSSQGRNRLRQGNSTSRSYREQRYNEDDADFKDYEENIAAMTPPDSQHLPLEEYKQSQRKKVFGRDIFSNKDLSFDPIMNIATPQNYVLGAGDEVSVDIYGASQKSVDCTVSPDGVIVIDGYGPVHVGGLTVAAAKARLRATLGSRYQSSRINLSLGQTRTITINVMGEVKAPGTYTLSAFASVFHALYMAGGTNDIGTLRNIKVYRNGRQVSQVDIYDYILNGKQSGNIRLADGDVIVVGPYDCLVNITGKVKRPMYYEMKKTESVKTLLSYAGGFAGDAYTKAVRLNRKTGREYSVYNIEEFDMGAFHLADGDSVSVDSVLPRYANTVEVKGAVFRPGMYQLGKSINSVRTLVEHAEGLTEQAFTNRAVMHRMKPDRTLEVISLDLGGIMSGEVADIPLKENDVLFVPSKQESQINRTITIHGEVLYPGIYEYADNETLEDFVLQAGGLKRDGLNCQGRCGPPYHQPQSDKDRQYHRADIYLRPQGRFRRRRQARLRAPALR